MLERSFREVEQRLRRAYEESPEGLTEQQRSLFVLEELQQFLTLLNPDQSAQIQQDFNQILQIAGLEALDNTTELAQRFGSADVEAAAEVVREGGDRINATQEREALELAATDSTASERLLREINDFRLRVRDVIGPAIARGEPIGSIETALKKQKNITRRQAETIVRTEVMGAYNRVNDSTLQQLGVEFVVFVATEDDRTCPWCTERSGNVYRRGEISIPLHPRCRCFTLPVDLDDEEQLAWADRHHADTIAEVDVDRLRRDAAPFERNLGGAPAPVRRAG